MMERDYFQCIPLTVQSTTVASVAFTPINGAGFEKDIKLLKIYNGSNVDITISYDGVEPHDFFPAGSTQIFDIQANHACNSAYSSGTKLGREGQIMYGTWAAGTGNFYIIGYY